MNSRERVLAALSRQPADRCAIDLGSSNVSSIHIDTYRRLLAHYGLTDERIRIMDYATQLVHPCEALLRTLAIDTRSVMLGPPTKERSQRHSDSSYTDAWGVRWSRPEGGTCFDVVESPLRDMTSLSEVEQYRFPALEELASNQGVAERSIAFGNPPEYALVGSFGSSIFMKAQQIRGYSQFFEDLLLDVDIAHYLMQSVLNLRIALVDTLLDACEVMPDIIEMADDVAGQDRLLMSEALYREMIKPYTQALIAHIKGRCKAKILYHSCGSVYPIVEDLIEIGVDILNPIQVSAAHMDDLVHLKERFGNRLCFWGGVDSQRLLPAGDERQVREAVRKTVNTLGAQGGYVLCASHNLQSDIPTKNIVAMYDQARKMR